MTVFRCPQGQLRGHRRSSSVMLGKEENMGVVILKGATSIPTILWSAVLSDGVFERCA